MAGPNAFSSDRPPYRPCASSHASSIPGVLIRSTDVPGPWPLGGMPVSRKRSMLADSGAAPVPLSASTFPVLAM